MDPMMIAKLLMGAGQGDTGALSLLDSSGVPPDFSSLLNPSQDDAGMALAGNQMPGLEMMMGGNTNFAFPPGMGPAPVSPPGGPQPATPATGPMAPAAPPQGGAPGNLAQRMRGIGQGLPAAAEPKFSGGVSGTPKGIADAVHKPPANAMSPAMMLMQALLGGRGKK